MGERTTRVQEWEEKTDLFFGDRPSILHVYGAEADCEFSPLEQALMGSPDESCAGLPLSVVAQAAAGTFPALVVVWNIVADRDYAPEDLGPMLRLRGSYRRLRLSGLTACELRLLQIGLVGRMLRRLRADETPGVIEQSIDTEVIWPIRRGERLVEVRFGLTPLPARLIAAA